MKIQDYSKKYQQYEISNILGRTLPKVFGLTSAEKSVSFNLNLEKYWYS